MGVKPPPYKHQVEALRRGRDAEFFAYFMQYGTGKSRVLIDNACELYREGRVRGALIVAPKGVYRNWQTSEIPTHMEPDIPYRVGYYDAKGNKASRESMAAILKPADCLDFLLINIESLATADGIRACLSFLRSRTVIMAIDESTMIKNPTAKRTKTAVKLGRLARYRRVLTGDPYANSPLDVFAQFEFLQPGALGFESFTVFRQAYAVLLGVPGAPRWVSRVVGYRNVEDLKKRVAPHAFFAEKPPLPPKVYLAPRQVEMLPKQRAAYDDMRRYSLAEIGRQLELSAVIPDVSDDELAKGTLGDESAEPALATASAEIVLTQMLRLQQIACGFVRIEDGQEVDLCDGKNPRIADVLDFLESVGPKAKVIIWCPFTYSIKQLIAAVTDTYGADSLVHYYGATTSEERECAKIAFQDPANKAHIFIGNQSTAGRGITLTQASYVLYFANMYDNELRANSEDRAHRIGLDHTVFYQDQEAAPVDTKVREALGKKKTLSEMLRDGSWRDLFA